MNISKLFNKEKRKIILSIGDEGAILTLALGRKMLKRIFVTSPSSQEFTDFMRTYPEVPTYVLVDVVDQAYIQQTLPPVSSMNAKKLVQRKLAKDFDKKDLKHAILMGRDKSGKKEWNYLFLAVRNVPPFSSWVESISDLPNQLKGIYLLPIETMNLLKDLKKLVTHQKDKTNIEWTILVSHNRVGGFRQVVYKNDRIIFTRIAQPIGMQTPDVIGGNIEQETLNTIEYIRRLGFDDKGGINIYIITSSEVKKVLEVNALPSNNPYILTPHEIACQLNLQGAAEKRDRFGDVMIAMHFITQKRHLLKLFTAYASKIKTLEKISYGAKALTALTTIGIICLIGLSFMSSSKISDKIDLELSNKAVKQMKLKDMGLLKNIFVGDKDRISEVANINNDISADKYILLDFINNYSSITGFNASVRNISLSLVHGDKKKKSKTSIKAELDIDFHPLKSFQIDQLLEELDVFISEVKRKFADYRVTFQNLPKEDSLEIIGSNSRSNNSDKQDNNTKTYLIKLVVEGPSANLPKTKGRGRR